MFDWVPLNTITSFYLGVIFFSTINFFYQYLPEAKGYLELSRASTMEFFREKNFFAKFTRKHLCRSLFLIKLQTGLYPQK